MSPPTTGFLLVEGRWPCSHAPRPRSARCRRTASGPAGRRRVWCRWPSSGTVSVLKHRVLGRRAPQAPSPHAHGAAPLTSVSMSLCPRGTRYAILRQTRGLSV